MARTAAIPPKYQRVFQALAREIERGRWLPGARIPSEAELVVHFGVSSRLATRSVC
jgi:DNA-binding GntR family transcriptional regulator